jgi:uracil-DNA glycosylase family 4
MFESPECQDCKLYKFVVNPCLPGVGTAEDAVLAIFVDQPNWMDDQRRRPFVSESADLIRHFIDRMGIPQSKVWLDYVLKCGAGKQVPSQKSERLQCIEACSKYRFATLQMIPNLKSIVTMGRIALEAFTGNSELAKFEGMSWGATEPTIRDLGIDKIWVTYNPVYLLEKPAETPEVYRVLWRAAEAAGLQPKETKVKPYPWDL